MSDPVVSDKVAKKGRGRPPKVAASKPVQTKSPAAKSLPGSSDPEQVEKEVFLVFLFATTDLRLYSRAGEVVYFLFFR